LGIHFSERYETAKEFAAGAHAGASLDREWQGEVVSARLRIEHPLEAGGELELAKLGLRVALQGGLASDMELDRWNQSSGVSWQEMAAGEDPGPLWLVDDLLNFGIGPGVVGAAVKAHLVGLGHDGVFYNNGYEELGERTAIVFGMEQIEVLELRGMGEEEKLALGLA
jgi:hypothetical protein